MKSYIRRTKEVCLFLDYPVDQASYEIDRITLQCGQNEWNITGVVTVNMMSLTHFLALTCCASAHWHIFRGMIPGHVVKYQCTGEYSTKIQLVTVRFSTYRVLG